MNQTAPQTLDRRRIDDRYQWDLDEIFPDFEAWEEAVAALEADVERMQSLEGSLSDGPERLLEVLQLNDRIDERAQRVWWYPTLMHDEDLRRNEIAARKQRVTALLSRAGTASAWFRPELLSLGEETVREWIARSEGLRVYEFLLVDLFRQKEHVLDGPRETLLSYTTQMANAPRDAYSMLSTADVQWPTIELASGEELKLTYSAYHHLLSTCRRQEDRARAFEALYATFGQHRNTYAALYGAVCHRDWFYARSRGYESSLQAALHGDDIPTTVVENLIETTKKGVAPLRRYYELRRRALGLDEIHLYDGQVPLLDKDLTYPYDTAVEHTVASVEILGRDYQEQMREGFRSRWIDVYENEGKRSGAYSAPVHGVHPYMLLNHKDTLGDMFTLAHEMGHSMHSVLSQRAQPYVYSDYTIFVAEVASTLNEGLLLDHLVARTEDPAEKALLLQHAIDSIVGTFYTQVLFADFELSAHRAVEAGEPVTADSLDDLYGGIFEAYYGDSIVRDAAYRHTWARIPHLFRAPYYVYQYATCFASAAAMRRHIREDEREGRRDAVERYLELLASGSSMHPMEQLQRAGVDLRRPEPVEDVVRRVDRLVSELENSLGELSRYSPTTGGLDHGEVVMRRTHRVLVRGCLAPLALALAACTGTGVGASGGPAERIQTMYESYREDSFPDVPDLSTPQAWALADSLGLVVLDVREPEERAVSIIPESLDETGFRALRRSGDRRPVLVYCTIGYRSGMATAELRDEGIEAYNLRGGILGWVHAGGEVEDPGRGEPVRRVHVHGRRWSLLPEGWEAVW